MNINMNKGWMVIGLAVMGVGLGNPVVRAQDDAKPAQRHSHEKSSRAKVKKMKMTPEIRKEMAERHQKMADCLKSDKPLSDCREEMMKDCPMKKGMGHCPMTEGLEE